MKKTVLITGVAGFIGSTFAKELDSSKYLIFGIDDLSSGNKKSIPKNVIFFKQDISKKIPKKLEDKQVNIDFIFHFAGQSSGEISFEDPIDDLKKNTITTINLIQFSIRKKIKKFFYMSSMSVYGDAKKASERHDMNPKTCYGVSKLSSEYYLKVFSNELNFIILRLFNVYGPPQKLDNIKQGMIRIYLTQLKKNNQIVVKGSTKRYRDFIFIDDVTKILKKLMRIKTKNIILNIGTGKKTTIENIISEIKKLHHGAKFKIEGNTKGDQLGIYADIGYLKKLIPNLKFKSLRKGLKDFYKSNFL